MAAGIGSGILPSPLEPYALNLVPCTFMSNSFFQFKQFIIQQDHCAMKVTTDACLFGAWVAKEIINASISPTEKTTSTFGKEIIIKNILDIGTGTGLLALMLAQQIAGVHIDAIEIDEEAAKQAKENAARSPWNDKINIINADARTFNFKTKYDLIVSNPPFYENEIKSGTVNKNVAHHSYELKLAQLLKIIKNNLGDGGHFFVLLPYKRNEEIKKLFRQLQLHTEKILFARQSVKHDFFRIHLKGTLRDTGNNETVIDEISIWDEKQQYKEEFTALLKDFYLYL